MNAVDAPQRPASARTALPRRGFVITGAALALTSLAACTGGGEPADEASARASAASDAGQGHGASPTASSSGPGIVRTRTPVAVNAPAETVPPTDLRLPDTLDPLRTVETPWQGRPHYLAGVYVGPHASEMNVVLTAIREDGTVLWRAERPLGHGTVRLVNGPAGALAVLTDEAEPGHVSASAFDLGTGAPAWGPVAVPGAFAAPGLVFGAAGEGPDSWVALGADGAATELPAALEGDPEARAAIDGKGMGLLSGGRVIGAEIPDQQGASAAPELGEGLEEFVIERSLGRVIARAQNQAVGYEADGQEAWRTDVGEAFTLISAGDFLAYGLRVRDAAALVFDVRDGRMVDPYNADSRGAAPIAVPEVFGDVAGAAVRPEGRRCLVTTEVILGYGAP
ncbi:MAG: hypothetical protein Q4G21_08245 [Dermabacter sp.]|nr:hypothetical protein [Dermabacter sp.]